MRVKSELFPRGKKLYRNSTNQLIYLNRPASGMPSGAKTFWHGRVSLGDKCTQCVRPRFPRKADSNAKERVEIRCDAISIRGPSYVRPRDVNCTTNNRESRRADHEGGNIRS